MFDCLLVNGDSYSAPTTFLTYSDHISKELEVPVTNLALAGSNNDRILRSTIEGVISQKKQNKNPLVIVGWSFVRRLEVWYYGNAQSVISKVPDKNSTELHCQPRFVTLNHLIDAGEATLEQKCLVQEDLFVHKQLTDFYTNIYLLSNTLNNMNVPWFMFSAAKNIEMPVHCFPYIESLELVQWCQRQPNIHKLHDFCIMNWAETNDQDREPVTGHLSENGHRKFSQELLNWIRSCKIV